MMATITEKIRDNVTVLPRLRSASSGLPSPMRRAASALPPLPTSMASAIMTTMAGKATVTAVRPISPTPTQRGEARSSRIRASAAPSRPSAP